MNDIEYYYYFGILEKKVGYDKNDTITMDELKRCISDEELYMYTKIEFNPQNTFQNDMVALISDNEIYSVLQTGERGSGEKLTFKEIGYALNYMLALLRLKKLAYLEENEKKIMLNEENLNND